MIALRRNVLLFHQAALGDFVLTWPIAMAAARLWPTNRTIYVTSPSKGQLAERAVGLEWRDGDSLHGLFGAGELAPAASKLLEGANLVISFLSTGDDVWAANVRRLAPEAQLVCVRPRPEGEIDRHLTLFHAEQLTAKPDLQAAVGQMLRHVAASGALPRRVAGERVVIHPGSGGHHKRWPAEQFAALARAFREAGHAVTVLLGEVERETWPASDVAAIRDAADTLATPLTLVELLAAIQSARLYIGNDSGPTHLAALAGVPTIALFGRDNDVTWRPLGPGVRVIKHLPLESLPVDVVAEAAAQMLAAPAAAAATPAVEED